MFCADQVVVTKLHADIEVIRIERRRRAHLFECFLVTLQTFVGVRESPMRSLLLLLTISDMSVVETELEVDETSVPSVSLRPPRVKNLIPLSGIGLCDAEIITPRSAPRSPTRNATAGVGRTPTRIASAPAEVSPATTAATARAAGTRPACCRPSAAWRRILNILERQEEARHRYLEVVKLTEDSVDPADRLVE